jgi:thymidylate synthase
MEYVEGYFANYLMDPKLEPNETYRYSTWLQPGVERVIEQLKDAPGNNQACISIGGYMPMEMENVDTRQKLPNVAFDTDDMIDPGTDQRDPACLRLVDFRLDQQNVLHMVVYFRSWDLWSGLPANLAGLQLLKEYVGQQLGAEDGSIIASSKGLHIYDHAIQVAASRVGMTDVGTMDDLLHWISHKEQKED